MVKTVFNDPDYYYTVESFCSTCGKTIFQYVDFDGTNIIYRENWDTPTGWSHNNPDGFKCREKYIEAERGFPVKRFRNSVIPSYQIKREEF
jgi:hypothetical protein